MQPMATDSPDEWLLHFVDRHRNAPLTWLARAMMDAGNSGPLLILLALLVLAVVVARRAWRPGIAMAVSFVAANAAVAVLKPFFARVRPPTELSLVSLSSYSMPSTHAAMTSAVAVSLLLTVRWSSRRRLRASAAALGVLLVLVGACMVYLGAHWGSDILAGWALGITIGATAGILCRAPLPAAIRPGGPTA